MRYDSWLQSQSSRSSKVGALCVFLAAVCALVAPLAAFSAGSQWFTEATFSTCFDADCSNVRPMRARVPGQDQGEAACRAAWALGNPSSSDYYVQATADGQCTSQFYPGFIGQLHATDARTYTHSGPVIASQVDAYNGQVATCLAYQSTLEAYYGDSLGSLYNWFNWTMYGEYRASCLWQLPNWNIVSFGDFYVYSVTAGTGSWRNVQDADPKDAGTPPDSRQRASGQSPVTHPKDGACPRDPEPTCAVGDPINAGTGNQFQIERDYSAAAPSALHFERTYNSSSAFQSGHIGANWRTTFDRSVKVFLSNGQPTTLSPAVVYRADGSAFYFAYANGQFTPTADIADSLTALLDGNNNVSGFRYVLANSDEVETYDATGKLLTVASPAGVTLSLTYDTKSTRLLSVQDQFGRKLQFTYDLGGRISTMTDPANGVYVYGYDGSDRLTSVQYPDQKTRTYVYNEFANTGGADLPNALTGIFGEDNQRFATFRYDASGRAVYAEHAGGALAVSLTYASGSTDVTDAAGATRTYSFTTLFGATRLGSITQPAASGTGTASRSVTLDANGNPLFGTDWNGNRTNYTYDLARNLETSRTEGLTSSGVTTPQTRTITTQWHAIFRLPTSIAEPLRITTNIYDLDGTACGARGALCSRTIQATTDANGSQGLSATVVGVPRTWTYTYNANGSVLTVDGPRMDVSDVTTYTYYANDDVDVGKRGHIATITNAAGHTASISAYNAHGQALTIVDPNGITTTLTYDARLRLKSRNVGGETTSYDYDNVGQLTKVTLPDTSFLSYTYDSAHRLVGMSDKLGNSISYTLDSMGNRTHEEVHDPANVLAQTRSRVYSNLNRLFQDIGAQGQTTEYSYDEQGNVLTVKDPLTHTSLNQYDALNRLIQVTDPGLGVTKYGYNGLDALTQVTDPRNLVTGYTVDGLGNLTLQSSPDTGNTTKTFDAAGNVLTQTDAKSQTTTYAYDALNRVTLITFQDGSKQAYVYDQNLNGKERLSSITETDPANNVTSQTAYTYDLHGRVISEARTIAGTQYVTGYTYDSAGRLSGMTYPSGRTLTYSFDVLGRISQIDTAKDNQSQTVVSSVTYQPFGGVKSFNFGNGPQSYTRTYDQDGRISSYTLGDKTYAVGYDAASRVEFISDTGTPSNSNTYGYDALDRLTSAVTPFTSYSYGYDAAGNRLSKTAGAGTDNYAYSPTSNQIASITPASGPVRSFVFDGNGSTTADGNNTYVYDTRGRMVQATSSIGTTIYQVNALGQRVRKTNTTTDTVFHYDTRGHLIAETDTAGNVEREFLYLDDVPVAYSQGGLYFIQVDHLRTPRLITNSSGTSVWKWDQNEPFGDSTPDQNPSGLGVFDFPLRFSGQYFDNETGLSDNWFRTYSSSSGRYNQSDPIGLLSGVNTYTYIGAAPLGANDPAGLCPLCLGSGATAGGATWWSGQQKPARGDGFGDDLFPPPGNKPSAGLPDWLRPWINSDDASQPADAPGERGLPPDGLLPPVPDADKCTVGPASRPSERAKGGKSLWDPNGGEWRYFPGDDWHNPHWDYNSHDAPSSPWVNVPIGGLPPVKPPDPK